MPKRTSGNNYPSAEEQRQWGKCQEKVASLQNAFNNFFTNRQAEIPTSESPEVPTTRNNTPTSGVS